MRAMELRDEADKFGRGFLAVDLQKGDRIDIMVINCAQHMSFLIRVACVSVP